MDFYEVEEQSANACVIIAVILVIFMVAGVAAIACNWLNNLPFWG